MDDDPSRRSPFDTSGQTGSFFNPDHNRILGSLYDIRPRMTAAQMRHSTTCTIFVEDALLRAPIPDPSYGELRRRQRKRPQGS